DGAAVGHRDLGVEEHAGGAGGAALDGGDDQVGALVELQHPVGREVVVATAGVAGQTGGALGAVVGREPHRSAEVRALPVIGGGAVGRDRGLGVREGDHRVVVADGRVDPHLEGVRGGRPAVAVHRVLPVAEGVREVHPLHLGDLV